MSGELRRARGELPKGAWGGGSPPPNGGIKGGTSGGGSLGDRGVEGADTKDLNKRSVFATKGANYLRLSYPDVKPKNSVAVRELTNELFTFYVGVY